MKRNELLFLFLRQQYRVSPHTRSLLVLHIALELLPGNVVVSVDLSVN